MGYYLPRAKKGALLKKLSDYCADTLDSFIIDQGIQKNELENLCGLPPNRVAEILGGRLSEPSLIKLIEGGIVTFMDLKSNHTLTEPEKDYLRGFALSEGGFKAAQLVAKSRELGLFDKGMDLLKDLIEKEEAKRKLKK